MKIALISSAQTTTPPIGYGSESRVSDLAVALAHRGHKVTLFAAEGSQPNGLYALASMPPAGSIADIRAAEATPYWWHRDLLLSHDVVHDLSLTARTHELLWQYGVGRSLVTLNGISFLSPEDPCARRNFVVVSKCAKRHALGGLHPWIDTPYEAAYGADVGKLGSCEVVRYGVDVEFYRPVTGVALPPRTALYVGRPHPSKGLDVLVRLARDIPTWNFMVAWRAALSDHKAVEDAFIRETRGIANLTFLELPAGGDHHYVKRDAMTAATVLLHPAIYVDACPSTVIEAQACGTPVVAFDRGGTPELLVNGETGVLVPYFRWWEDEKRIAKAFQPALEWAARLDRRAVRRYAEIDLSADRMASEYEQLCARAAKGETW